MSTTPLLSARDLRVDVDGAVAVERATFETTGRSAVVVGDGHGLLAAVTGAGVVRAGSLTVLGVDIGDLADLRRNGRIGLVPLNPPLPERWTTTEVLVASAHVAGMGLAAARRRADLALAEVGLSGVAREKVAGLARPYRRALVLAQSAVTSPELIVAVSPLSGLSGSEAEYVARALQTVVRERAWIASVSGRTPGSPEHALAASADEILLFASGRLVRQARLRACEKEATLYTLTLRGNVAQFADALQQKGIVLGGGPQRFWIELPPQTTPNELLSLSQQMGASVVELVPQLTWKAEG